MVQVYEKKKNPQPYLLFYFSSFCHPKSASPSHFRLGVTWPLVIKEGLIGKCLSQAG